MKTKVLILVAAAIYLLAWFVPVEKDLAHSLVPGWEAFWIALAGPFESTWDGPWYAGALYVSSALTNFVLVGALVVVFIGRRSPGRLLQVVLIACAVINTHWVFW